MALTPEQKRLRLEAFGASEGPTLVRKGHGKLIDLWRSKVDPSSDPEVVEEQNDLLELGEEYEDPVCRIYARRTGTFLARVDTLRHPTKPLAVATPDRARFTSHEAMLAVAGSGPVSSVEALQNAERLVEAKSTGSRYRRDFGRAGTGEVPEEKALQCIWQMGVTGLRVVDLPVVFMGEWGRRIEVFTVTWNEEVFEWMYEAAERFWHDHVLTKKPPEPDGSDAYDEVLAETYTANSKPPIPADPDDERLMLDFARWREVEKRAEVMKKRAAQTLKARIGLTDGLVSSTLGKLSWKHTKDSVEVDHAKALQEALALSGLCLNAFDVLAKTGEQLNAKNRTELEARLRAIVPNATSTTPGHRRLLFTPKKGSAADLSAARLRTELPALNDGK